MTFLYFASDSFESRAKVLVDSIKKYHPESSIVHIKPNDHPIGSYIPGMAKQRLETTLELLEDGHETVIVIGADCELFTPLNDALCFERLNDMDILLTPHIIEPVNDRMKMAQFYRTGHVNADFMVFKNTDRAKACLQWLISVTEDNDPINGIFYEQTWLSALPFLFKGIYILKSPAYNVAYFNIFERNFRYREKVNQPLTCFKPISVFQYSGYEKGKPERMSKYYSGPDITGDMLKFFQRYDERIER